MEREPIVVLVTGDRDWNNYDSIRTELEKLPSGSAVVHGACRGADRIAGEIAEELGLEPRPYPADWRRYRGGAGPIRNQQMLDEEPEISLVLAFHPDLTKSKGTKDMVERSEKAGKPVRRIKA